MSPISRDSVYGYAQIMDPPLVLDGGGTPPGGGTTIWTGGPSGSFGGNRPAVSPSRAITISGSIVGSTLPLIFGARKVKVAGQWWLWYRFGETGWAGWAVFSFGEGELGSIDTIELNDTDIDDLTGYYNPDRYVTDYGTRLGADTQTLPSFLGLVPDLVETWPGLAYVAMKLDTTEDSPIPSSIRCSALCTGIKIDDFRTAPGTPASTSNPVVIAHEILTNSEWGLARSTSMIDTANWTAAANHTATLMSDSTGRYEFNGVLYERDLFRAINTVLGHAMMRLEVDPASGKYIIATLESGLTSSATIELTDWKSNPKWKEIPLSERPNHVTVQYTDQDTWRPASVHVEDPAGVSAADLRKIEVSLPGCYNASIATRFAVKRYNHAATEKFRWWGRLGTVIADVLPGELVTLTTRALTSQSARLLKKTQVGFDTWDCEFVEYDPATDSTAVATDDTPPSVALDPPDPPTAATEYFMELGDWDLVTEFDEPDDLTGWGTFGSTLPTVTYDATEDCTQIVSNITGAYTGVYSSTLTRPSSALFGILKLEVRWGAAQPDTDARITVSHYAGDPLALERTFVITPSDEKLNYETFGIRFPLGGDTQDRINIGVYTGSGTATFRIKRVRFVYSGLGVILPELSDPQPNLGWRKHFTWTEDAGAEDTVVDYRLVSGELLESVPVGVAELVRDFSPVDSGIAHVPFLASADPYPKPTYPNMYARGINGVNEPFPDETQTFTTGTTLEPLSPTAVGIELLLNTERRTTDSEEIANWTHVGTPTITSDVETGPSGVTNEADRVTNLGYDAIEMRDSDSPDPWFYTDGSGSHLYFVWGRREAGTFETLTLCDATNPDLNLHEVVLRSTYNLLVHRTDVTDSPSNNSPVITVGTGTGEKMNSPDALILGGAFLWPVESDANHKFALDVFWTAAADADSLDGYEVQYKIQDTSTLDVSGWRTHFVLPRTALGVKIGTSVRCDCPFFPITKDLQLYDWRVVAKRGNAVTELVPSTVTETDTTETISFQKLRDFDDTTSGTILTMPDGIGEDYNVELATVAGLGIEDDDVALSVTPTGVLSGDVTVADAMATVDGIDANGITFDNDIFGLKWANKLASGTILGWKVNTNDILEAGVPVVLQNADYLFGRNNADTADVWIAGVSSSDVVTIGSGTYGTRINSGGTLYLSPAGNIVDINGDVDLPNDYTVRGEIAAGSTFRKLIGLNTSDQVQIGSTSSAVLISSSGSVYLTGLLDISDSIYLENAKYLYGKETGATSRVMIGMNASDQVVVGNANNELALLADGTIDAGANDITTTGEMIADHGDFEHSRWTKKKTLTLGTTTTLAQLTIAAAPSAASCILEYEVEVVDSSDVQVEAGTITWTAYRTSGGQVANYTKAATSNQASTGTVTVTPATYVATAGIISIRVLVASTGLTSPTCEIRMKLNGNADRSILWV